jgi:hypothetical protein
MPFASINPTNPRTNLSFFESAILNLKKKKKNASFPSKPVQNYTVEWMGGNFDVFPGFQKIPCYA